MRERPIIHVAGPAGAGKTTFIEALLEGVGGLVLAARCIRDDSLRDPRETTPRGHRELARYRKAGAAGAALFAFPESDVGSDAFFMTHLMGGYSEAVVLEGDNPVGFADLEVFVAPPLPVGCGLFIRTERDWAKEKRAKADAVKQLLRKPDGMAELLGQIFGAPIASLSRRSPDLLEESRASLLAEVATARKAPLAKPTQHWTVADGYAGIERAQLIVVNIREERERARGERLTENINRLRKDAPLFDDILGFRGSKSPVTAVVANLDHPNDPGRKKALARVRRALRRKS